MTKTEFVEKAIKLFGCRYGLHRANYVNSREKVEIFCKIHGYFFITANSFLRGNGCKKCGQISANNLNSSCQEEFIKKIIEVHGNIFDLSKTIYTGSRNKVIVICRKHGEFSVIANNLTSLKQGCPVCSSNFSKPEILWLNSIEEKEGIKIIRQHRIIINNSFVKVDGFCKETNTIYEFNGDYFHGNPKKFDHMKINKTRNCTHGELYNKTIEREKLLKEASYNVISIWESDYKIKSENKKG